MFISRLIVPRNNHVRVHVRISPPPLAATTAALPNLGPMKSGTGRAVFCKECERAEREEAVGEKNEKVNMREGPTEETPSRLRISVGWKYIDRRAAAQDWRLK